jgi:hypothetical protein
MVYFRFELVNVQRSRTLCIFALAEAALVFTNVANRNKLGGGCDSADIIPLHDVLLYGTNTPVSPSLIQYGSSSLAIVEADNGEGEGEDFFTRDGLQLLSNDNYLSDELEDTLDLLLGTTTTN